MRLPRFGGTLIDAPWPEKGGKSLGGAWGNIKRGADSKYDVLTVNEILTTIQTCPVWNPADDAHLYFWVTDKFLPHGLWIIGQLGFTYTRVLAWPKKKHDASSFGLGQYFRTKHELCLFATRGKGYAACTEATNLTTLIADDAPLTGSQRIVHSRKPHSIYEKVEARAIGPFAEIFARKLEAPRRNWVHWGDDVSATQPNVSLWRG